MRWVPLRSTHPTGYFRGGIPDLKDRKHVVVVIVGNGNRYWIITAYIGADLGSGRGGTGAIENLEVLFFSTRLLRGDLFEVPIDADLHIAEAE